MTACAVCRSTVGPTVCAACHREERRAREQAEQELARFREDLTAFAEAIELPVSNADLLRLDLIIARAGRR